MSQFLLSGCSWIPTYLGQDPHHCSSLLLVPKRVRSTFEDGRYCSGNDLWCCSCSSPSWTIRTIRTIPSRLSDDPIFTLSNLCHPFISPPIPFEPSSIIVPYSAIISRLQLHHITLQAPSCGEMIYKCNHDSTFAARNDSRKPTDSAWR